MTTYLVWSLWKWWYYFSALLTAFTPVYFLSPSLLCKIWPYIGLTSTSSKLCGFSWVIHTVFESWEERQEDLSIWGSWDSRHMSLEVLPLQILTVWHQRPRYLAFLKHQDRCFASLFPIPVLTKYSSFTPTPPSSLSVLTTAPATQGICLWSHLAGLWKPRCGQPWPSPLAARFVDKSSSLWLVLFGFVLFQLRRPAKSSNFRGKLGLDDKWKLKTSKEFFFPSNFTIELLKLQSVCLSGLSAEVIRKNDWTQGQCPVDSIS